MLKKLWILRRQLYTGAQGYDQNKRTGQQIPVVLILIQESPQTEGLNY